MDRRITAWSLALGVCLGSAQADTYTVRGRDRAGSPVSGSVELTKSQAQSEGEGGAVRIQVELGPLSVGGTLNEAGVFTVGAPSDDSSAPGSGGAGQAGSAAEARPGLSSSLAPGSAPRQGEAPPQSGASPYPSRPVSGTVEVQEGRLRLERRDADGRAVIRVTGRPLDATAAESATAAAAGAGASGGQGALGGGERGTGGSSPQQTSAEEAPKTKTTKRAPSVEKLAAAEAKVAEAARRLSKAEVERGERSELEREAAAYSAELDGAEGSGGLDMAWESLREDYEVAVGERDALQGEALQAAWSGGDLEAANDLVAANSARLGDATRELQAAEQPTSIEREERERLQAHLAQARSLRDRLQQLEQRAAIQQRDLYRAEELVRENTERLANSQVALVDDDEVTAEERAEHERLVELQRQAAAARDHLHDRAIREILDSGDVAGAEQLVTATTGRVAASSRVVADAWEEQTAYAEEHERLLWHQRNAVELRGHVLREARQRALERKDLAAAQGLASSAVARLALAEATQGEAPGPVEAAERKRLEANYREATALREHLRREAIEVAQAQLDLAAAQQLVAVDSAELAAFAVLNQHRAEALTAVERKEAEALYEFQRDALALRTQLFERRVQDVRLKGDPQLAEALLRSVRANQAQLEAELERRGLANSPLPDFVAQEREALTRQQEHALALRQHVDARR